MPTPPTHTIDLGLGFSIEYSFATSTQLDWSLLFMDGSIAAGSVSLGAPTAPVNVTGDLLQAEVDVTIDPLSGAIGFTATVQFLEGDPPAWKTVLDLKEPHFTLMDPTKGDVAGSESGFPPEVIGYGPNGPSGGGDVTRFHISDEPRVLADVGRIVKQALFATTGPLTLNIIACVGLGADPGTGPGVYADPESPWFNVFFGIYQVDCAKADGWTRPFGYEAARGVASSVHGEDIVRIGNADWNWFSNYLYGVPEDVCRQYTVIDMSKVTFEPTTLVRCGNSQWHQVTMSGVEVASAYQSDAPGARQLVQNSPLTADWRTAFGLPCPRPEYPTSFIPTTLSSSLFMTYSEDDAGYHTLMFGGTAGVDTEPGFLQAQVAAAASTIKAHYPDDGFPLG